MARNNSGSKVMDAPRAPSASYRQLPFTQGGMVLLRHERRAAEGHHPLAALVLDARLDRDGAAIAPLRLARAEHGGLGVERVADKHRQIGRASCRERV